MEDILCDEYVRESSKNVGMALREQTKILKKG